MTKSSYKNEVLKELDKKRTRISLNESNSDENMEGLLECSCQEHDTDAKLREGNKIYAVIIKQNEEWIINNTTCWQCSVRDIVERITEDVPIAIVEGTLKHPSENNKSEFCIINSRVWNVMVPPGKEP